MLIIHSIIPYTVIGREICLIPSEWRIAIIYIFIKHCIGSNENNETNAGPVENG